jgi:predicted anti-sigma-YlaC factor YlaD
MNCKGIRKYLPLYIAADLSSKKKEAVRIHLETCGECKKEHEAYARSIKTAKEWLSASTVTWGEGEWRRTVQNARAEKEKSLSEFAPWSFKKGWAFAVMGAVMVVVVFFITRPLFLGVKDFPGQTILSRRHPQHEAEAISKSPQDVVSMTMVSKDTGLKVVWILNKNFNLEENE